MGAAPHRHERRPQRATPPASAPARALAPARGRGGMTNHALARALDPGVRAGGVEPDGTVTPDVQRRIEARAGGGGALDSATRGWADGLLGGGAHHVRVHHDASAARLAGAVAARAFTVGNDVFFGAGQYRPHTGDGRRLLAHELTHVVQQRGGPSGGRLRVTEPGDAHEREAERVADDLS